MTVISRKTVRDEIAAALSTAIAGSGKPVSSVFGYQPGQLNGESPVVLILSAGSERQIAGLGAKKYDNRFEFELHFMVYDGKDNQPLTEKQREDKVDEIEALAAEWFANNQSGTNYRALRYTTVPTQITTVTYLDGNPYRLEIVKISLEAPDL
jgi:hypothetical protein